MQQQQQQQQQGMFHPPGQPHVQGQGGYMATNMTGAVGPWGQPQQSSMMMMQPPAQGQGQGWQGQPQHQHQHQQMMGGMAGMGMAGMRYGP